MIILGMNFSHDGSVALVKDGKLISAIGTERITRKKKDFGVTVESIQYVLETANLSFEQVDAIALADYLLKHSNDILHLYDEDGNQIGKTNYRYYHNDVRKFRGIFMGKELPVFVLPHHLAHCASAYYTSTFDKALCFSLDSSFGELPDNNMIAVGDGNKLNAVSYAPLISGIGYATFTELLGFTPAYSKAGTTMGLSSYGTRLDTNRDFVSEMFFTPKENAELEYRIYWSDIWTELSNKHPHELTFRESADLAATIQHILTGSVVHALSKIKTDIDNLCLSGGSFLNCVTNTAVKRMNKFKSIHHFQACGDDGNSVGSALYVAHHIFDEPRYAYESQDLAYLGRKQEYIEPNYTEVASMIAEGKIVAWFMGASEYGPRALGNRSILADPRTYHNREKINFAVKNREWFRPLAPAVLEEYAHEWFDFDGPSPFMLYTSQVLHPEKIPAVTHVDGSARHQTVTERQNLPFYRLIKAFQRITGVPVLMNTSLNGNAQPILETEEQAMDFFRINTSIDAIVINGRIYKR